MSRLRPDGSASADDAAGGVAIDAAAHGVRRWWWVGALALGLVALLGGVALGGSLRDRGTDHRYVIPAGTGDRIAAGEAVQLIPATLTFDHGDSLTVTNDDDRVHQIGVFGVRPGETVTYRFPNPGTFQGACSVHTGGSLTITIV